MPMIGLTLLILIYLDAPQPHCTFTSLPLELRIQVYKEIINEHPYRLPTPASLHEYQDLILSCKQFKDEFEREWVLPFNRSLSELTNNWGHQPRIILQTPPVLRIKDCHHIDIVM